MAYFSGNGFYLRNYKRVGKSSIDIYMMCGSALITASKFENNIGLRKHNGGAATVICSLISDVTKKEYYHTSTFINIWLIIEPKLTL